MTDKQPRLRLVETVYLPGDEPVKPKLRLANALRKIGNKVLSGTYTQFLHAPERAASVPANINKPNLRIALENPSKFDEYKPVDSVGGKIGFALAHAAIGAAIVGQRSIDAAHKITDVARQFIHPNQDVLASPVQEPLPDNVRPLFPTADQE